MTYTFKLARRLARLRPGTSATLALIALGCADTSTAPTLSDPGDPASLASTDDPVVRVELSPSQVSCTIGGEVSLIATPYRASGTAATERRIIFRVRDSTVARVTVTGARTATVRCKTGGRTAALADIDRQHDSTLVTVATGGGTPAPTPSPSPTPTVSGSLPFGLMHTPIDEYGGSWTTALVYSTPAYLGGRLARAQSNGMKLIVVMGGTNEVQNADGTFSLTRWKASVDRYRSMSLGGYITRGTLFMHYLIDEPSCAACWGGKSISWETVEEMARYSKSIWPGLPTAARSAPSKLSNADFTWRYLDAGWAQYSTRKGDLRTYLEEEVAAARREGLGLVGGLNLLDGSGTYTAPMSASQLRTFGSIMAADPAVCALVGWRHDSRFLNQTGMRSAVEAVADVARSRKGASCVVG